MNSKAVRRHWLPIALVICLAAIQLFSYDSKPTTNVIADKVVVMKEAHTLTLFRDGRPIKSYQVALGRGGLANKIHAGDNRVPEGSYRITAHNPRSGYHLALRIGYPTPEQSRDARLRGIDPGRDIMIHGIRNGLGWLGPMHRLVDWTKGCIALTDREIDEVGHAVPDGTVIEIRQ